MTKKEFDCVEMKREGAAWVRAQIAGMTREQQIEYWKRRSEEFRRGAVDPKGTSEQGRRAG